MKRNLFALVWLVIFPVTLSAGICLTNEPIPQKTSQESSTIKTRKVRFGLIGYLLLPIDYRVYQTDDLRDAWYGYIVSSDDTFRIRYAAGLVESPFQNGRAKFVWLKRERIYKGSLTYGLLKTENGGEMAATVGFVNFYAASDSEAHMKMFLAIVRSYRVEQCQDCERALPNPPSNKRLQLTARQHFYQSSPLPLTLNSFARRS